MSHLLGEVLIRILDILVVLPLFFVSLENHVCLSCGVQVAGATWCVAMRIMVGVGDLVQRTADGRTGRVLGGRAIEKSGGVVCGLHRARCHTPVLGNRTEASIRVPRMFKSHVRPTLW
jgi:hypothetical protein